MVPSREARLGATLLLAWGTVVVLIWGFAFLPVPSDDSWIAAAKSVCFGSAGNGLPGPGGWLVLIGAPVALLGILLAGLRREVREGAGALRVLMPWRALALVLATLFVVDLGMVGWQVSQARQLESIEYGPTAQGALPADYPRQDRLLPAFHLVDQSGADVQPESFRGHATVLSFVFAHCQTVCPVLVQTTSTAVDSLGADRVALAYLTLDPRRDTPVVLSRIAEEWGLPEGARLLSGDPLEVERLLDELQIGRQTVSETGDIVHAPLVFVLDGEGRIAYVLDNPPPGWIVDAVRRILDAS